MQPDSNAFTSFLAGLIKTVISTALGVGLALLVGATNNDWRETSPAIIIAGIALGGGALATAIYFVVLLYRLAMKLDRKLDKVKSVAILLVGLGFASTAHAENIWAQGETHCRQGNLARYQKDEFGHQSATPSDTDKVTLCWSLGESDENPSRRLLRFSIRTSHFLGGDTVEASEWLPLVKAAQADIPVLFEGKMNGGYGDEWGSFWQRGSYLTARIGTSHSATYVTVSQ